MKKQRPRFKKKQPFNKKVAPPVAGAEPAASPAASADVGIGKTRFNSQVLNQVEQKIESSLTPETRDAYQRVVIAGMRVALKDGPNSILASLRESKDPVSDSAKGAVNLAVMLLKEFRMTIPPKALIPAALTLMLEGLDFAEKLGKIKVDTDLVNSATHVFTNQMAGVFHIDLAKLQNAGTQVHGVMSDPTKMEMIARRAGVVKSPMASTPTAMPEQTQET